MAVCDFVHRGCKLWVSDFGIHGSVPFSVHAARFQCCAALMKLAATFFTSSSRRIRWCPRPRRDDQFGARPSLGDASADLVRGLPCRLGRGSPEAGSASMAHARSPACSPSSCRGGARPAPSLRLRTSSLIPSAPLKICRNSLGSEGGEMKTARSIRRPCDEGEGGRRSSERVCEHSVDIIELRRRPSRMQVASSGSESR